jgi:hypothetical protein
MNKEKLTYRSDNAKAILKWFESFMGSTILQQTLKFNVLSTSQSYAAITKIKPSFTDGEKIILISDQLRLKLNCTILSSSVKERDQSPIVLDESSTSVSSL